MSVERNIAKAMMDGIPEAVGARYKVAALYFYPDSVVAAVGFAEDKNTIVTVTIHHREWQMNAGIGERIDNHLATMLKIRRMAMDRASVAIQKLGTMP